MVSVAFDEVVKNFGDVAVLKGITASVTPGGITFVMGSSGCGKTTLLRVLAGLEIADSGNVFIDDQSLIAVPPEKRGVGMVFQNYALWPHLTVYKNISFPLEVRGWTAAKINERVAELIEKVGLANVVKSFPHQLSGGQQQRVALARALSVSPKVLLLDEPFSNLDTSLRDEIRAGIKNIQRQEGLTVIIVSHDFEDAQAIGDSILFLSKGKVLQCGSPRELYQQPYNLEVALATGVVNHFDQGFIRPELCSLCVDQKNPAAVNLEEISSVRLTAEEVQFSRGFFRVKALDKNYFIPAARGATITPGDTVTICYYKSDLRSDA